MTSHLFHAVAHAVHEGSIFILAAILITFAACACAFTLALYLESFKSSWTNPPSAQALQGASVENSKMRSRLQALSGIEIEVDESRAHLITPMSFFRFNKRFSFCIALFIFACVFPIIKTAHDASEAAKLLEPEVEAPAQAHEFYAPDVS